VVILQTFPLNDFCNNSLILAGTCSLQDNHRPYLHPEGDRLRPTYLQPIRASLRSIRVFAFAENRLGLQPGKLPSDWLPDQSNQDLRRRAWFEAQARAHGLEYEGFVYSLLPDSHQPPSIQQAWGTTRRILHQIASAASDRGIPLISLVIPFSKTFVETWPEIQAISTAPMERDYATRQYELFLDELRVEVISVRRRIEEGNRPDGDYFISPTDGHLSLWGHAQCAVWVFEAIQQVIHRDWP